jgi:hypothetical protein
VFDDLLNSILQTVKKAAAVAGCAFAPVGPTIVIAAPKLILVKKSYQTNAHRIELQLGTTGGFTGTSQLTCSALGTVRVFNQARGGTALTMPYNTPGNTMAGGLAGSAPPVNPAGENQLCAAATEVN